MSEKKSIHLKVNHIKSRTIFKIKRENLCNKYDIYRTNIMNICRSISNKSINNNNRHANRKLGKGYQTGNSKEN